MHVGVHVRVHVGVHVYMHVCVRTHADRAPFSYREHSKVGGNQAHSLPTWGGDLPPGATGVCLGPLPSV